MTQGISRLIAAVLTLAIAPQVAAQNPAMTATTIADSVRREIDAASSSGNTQRLAGALALAERALVAYPNDAWLEHYLGFAHYRSSAIARGMKDDAKLKMHLEQAQKALERSIAKSPGADSHALLSAVLGQMIGGMLDGMRLGPRSDRELERALELGPNNPRVWVIRASSVLYKPALFGGSPAKAEEYARKAITLLTGDKPAAPAPAWGDTDAYTLLGQALVAQKKYPEAKSAYEKVMTLEPGNAYVTYVLMPELVRLMR